MIQKIKEIVERDILDSSKEELILEEISNSSQAIIRLMKIIDYKFNRNIRQLQELNLLLSKADIAIEDPKMNKNNFIQKEIEDFYKKNPTFVHCFNKYRNDNS